MQVCISFPRMKFHKYNDSQVRSNDDGQQIRDFCNTNINIQCIKSKLKYVITLKKKK